VVLASIDGYYDLVYAWNATSGLWMKYDPNVPYGASLTSLDEKMGFWIEMNTAGTLTIGGTAPLASIIALNTGWNLVGFPASATLVLPDAFSLHGLGSTAFLTFAYHASDSADPWKLFDSSSPAYRNDLTALAQGWGYWVKPAAASSWEVSY
jgi:hypothetical protein